jgi:hypothetical protein
MSRCDALKRRVAINRYVKGSVSDPLYHYGSRGVTMNYKNDKQTPRWRALSLLLISCAMLAAAMPAPQEEEDMTRRLWNKQFLKAREEAKKPKPSAQPQMTKTKPPAGAKPGAAASETVDGELIGVTIWRLRPAAAGDDRILVQKNVASSGQYALERVTADTRFKEGQLVRISVEAPREYDNYLYVVDREVYKDNKGERLGEPSLIFPARSTPPGGNVISAGRSVYVPAQGDPIPYFTLQRSGENHVGEMLFILISPKPLPAPVGRPTLDMATVAQWERQCSGQTERRESSGGAGRKWTKEEQEADEGTRKLVQSDPLPQTIYRVRVRQGGCALVPIPLRFSPYQIPFF